MRGSSFFQDNPTRIRVGGSTGGRCFSRCEKHLLGFLKQRGDAVLDGSAYVFGALRAAEKGLGFFKNDVCDRRILGKAGADPFDDGKETLRGLFVDDGEMAGIFGVFQFFRVVSDLLVIKPDRLR